jgi:hypothetical protein
VRLALKVVMLNDGNFVDAILIYTNTESNNTVFIYPDTFEPIAAIFRGKTLYV